MLTKLKDKIEHSSKSLFKFFINNGKNRGIIGK